MAQTNKQSDEIKVAVLATELAHVKEALTAVLNKLDIMSSNYLTKVEASALIKSERDQATLEHAAIQKDVNDVVQDMVDMKKSIKWWVTTVIALSSAIAVIIGLFIK